MIPEIGFAGLSAMSEADLLQLPPVSGKLIFSEISDKGSMKHLLGLKLWNLFSICRWTRNEDFQYGISRFLEKYGRETVFITLDGAGNYWKK